MAELEDTSASTDNSNDHFAVLSEADRDILLCNKNAESTKVATKFAVKTFHDCLDQLLAKFYPLLRNMNGEKYAVQSLRSIRAGIQRYYTEPPRRWEINIISGENFTRSKAMFEAVCVDLEKNGLGVVTHKPVINDEDMAKISNYHTEDETWFENKPRGKNTLGALMVKENAVAIRTPTTVALPQTVQNTNAYSTCMQLDDDIDFLDDSFISESADFD
ncbi:KCTD1_15 [Mytilus coruscus]|uniref:KCTD1_15 n=1 Tax=Mytilus coruscus TaxID=42192 RepID=A0A6J8E1N1_MYTCO|nr:KCTD1_15 [Mytilus coruscus]